MIFRSVVIDRILRLASLLASRTTLPPFESVWRWKRLKIHLQELVVRVLEPED